jgi:hypothetical protein
MTSRFPRITSQGPAMSDRAQETADPGSRPADSPATDESRSTSKPASGPPPPEGPAERADTPGGPNPAADEQAGKPGPVVPGPPAEEPAAPGADESGPAERDDRPYLRRAEEEEQEWQQRRRNLRDLEEEDLVQAGRDWIGRDANQVTGGGSMYSAGGNIWIGTAASGPTAQISYLPRSVAARLTECMVEPQSQAELAAALDREPLVLLQGAAGSGRRTAALAALLTWVRTEDSAAHHADPEHVGVIGAASWQHAEPELRKHHGYVLDAASGRDANDFQDHLDSLRYLAEQCGCRVIVLMSGGGPELSVRHVDHIPPAAPEIFRRWLTHEARDAGVDEHALDELLTEIDDDLRGSSPREAVQLACGLVGKHKAGRSAGELRDELPRRVRDDIRRRLVEGGPVLGRCFMTSAAVLNGLPEATVSDAALRLAKHISDVGSVTAEQRPPAWQHLHSWLDYADATTSPGHIAGIGPTVQMRRRVEKATLRVLWEEQPTIRQPMIAWLREIAESTDPSAQRKAAHAAGVLATFDFDAAVDRFITPWSKSRRLRDHRIAAMMLESAVGAPDIAPRVYALLQKLGAGARGERLVAAHALGSRIGLIEPGEALRELRKIALDLNVEICMAVAGSIGNLYTAASAAQILRELAGWVNTRSSGGLYTSALAFVRLAMLGNADPDRPPLIRLEFDKDLGEHLVVLWWNSLSLRIVTSPARPSELVVPGSWTVLARWVSQYNQEPAIRAVIDEVFADSPGSRRLRRTLRLHLRQWQRRNRISADVHAQLIKMLKAG